jgi:hypothetical protein
MALLSTQDTEKVRRLVVREAAYRFGRGKMRAFYEHGHWWVENPRTGAQYDVVDTVPGPFGFEQVSSGEDY